MEGLEAIEISYKESLLADNETFRFDSEYFRKELLEKIKQIKNLTPDRLETFAKVQGGKRLPLGDDFSDSGIPYIRAEDVKNSFVQHENSPFISEKTHFEIAAYQTKKDDVLLTIVGNSIGDVGIVKFELDRCNLTENCVKVVVPLESRPYLSDYLFLFFMSHYGQSQIEREKVGTAQPKLAIERIRRFLVPTVSRTFQIKLSNTVECANHRLASSRKIYAQAESLLLKTLGMANFSPSAEAINVKSLKDSFAATGRLDAEYYQPKYEQIVDHIAAQNNARLIKLVDIKKSIEPGSDAYSEDEEGLPFLRVADYSKYGIAKPQKCLSAAFVAENRAELEALIPKKNTILFSKDGSVGEAYCLREDANFITSGAVLHLTVLDPDHLQPEYLTLALNSKLVRMQAERDAGGSIILHWRVGEIENVLVPLVDKPTQEKIAAMVQESFSLKAESERLLDIAKRAVEIAIEHDEKAGMAYIQENS